MSNPVMRGVWVVCGLGALALGTVGIIVPGLPSTVFFICAAWCFSKSSPRLERWLLNLPLVGSLVSDYRAGLGMPKKAKVMAVSSIVIACGLSVAIGVETWWVRLIIAATGAFGIWWILAKVPTREATQTEEREREDVALAGRIFRIAAAVEATTWAGLLVGMGLKYFTDVGPGGVEFFGPVHGVVVLVYVGVALWAGTSLQWAPRSIALALLASVPPFATIQFERWATSTGQLRAPERR